MAWVLLMARVGMGLAAEDDTSQALSFLESRNNSVSTCELRVHQYCFDLTPDSYQAFKRAIVELGAVDGRNANLTQLASDFARKWSNAVNTLEVHALWKGKQFKETRKAGDKVSWTTAYDGELYRDYRTDNEQLDILASVPSVLKIGTDEMGITNSRVLSGATAKTVTKNGEGYQCTLFFREDNSFSRVEFYDPSWGLRHSEGKDSGVLSYEQWYLKHKTIDGYSVPQIKVDASMSKRGCSITLLVLESARINCPLTDEDMAIGKLPPWTLVVDRRHNPPIRNRLVDTPDALLRNEVLLDDRSMRPLSPGEPSTPAGPPADLQDLTPTTPQRQLGAKGERSGKVPPSRPSDANEAKPPASHGASSVAVGLVVLAVAAISGAVLWRRRDT